MSTVKLFTAYLSYPLNTYSSPFHCFLLATEFVVAGCPLQRLLCKALNSNLPDLSIMKMLEGGNVWLSSCFILGFLGHFPWAASLANNSTNWEIGPEYWARFFAHLSWVFNSWISWQNSAPGWASQASGGTQRGLLLSPPLSGRSDPAPCLLACVSPHSVKCSTPGSLWCLRFSLGSGPSGFSCFSSWLILSHIFYKFYLTFLVVLSRSIDQLQAIPSQLEG